MKEVLPYLTLYCESEVTLKKSHKTEHAYPDLIDLKLRGEREAGEQSRGSKLKCVARENERQTPGETLTILKLDLIGIGFINVIPLYEH